MDDSQFKKEVDKFRSETQEEVEKKKFNWKSFSKRAYDLWLTTSVNIYNGLIKFSDSIQERQRKNDKLDKKAGVQNTPETSPDKHTPEKKQKDPFEPTTDWGFDL